MKQKSKWQIAKIITRNLIRLLIATAYHVILAICFRTKWLYQDILAKRIGYKSHADMMQKRLDAQHSQVAIA